MRGCIAIISFFIIGIRSQPEDSHSARRFIRSQVCEIGDVDFRCAGNAFVYENRSFLFLTGKCYNDERGITFLYRQTSAI